MSKDYDDGREQRRVRGFASDATWASTPQPVPSSSLTAGGSFFASVPREEKTDDPRRDRRVARQASPGSHAVMASAGSGQSELGGYEAREKAHRKYRELQATVDERRRAAVTSRFEEAVSKGLANDDLHKLVQTKLLPNLVTLHNEFGQHGVGFFQHERWLVSNAHLLPHPDLVSTVSIRTLGGEHVEPRIKQKFIRPVSDATPDLIILQRHEGAPGAFLGLPWAFSESAAAVYEGDMTSSECFFYIDNDKAGNCHIAMLILLDDGSAGHQRYRRADGFNPRPGQSGSPIFAARVMHTGHRMIWDVKVVSVLYARQKVSSPTHEVDQFDLCTLPIQSEFEQLRAALWFEDERARAVQLRSCYEAVGREEEARTQGVLAQTALEKRNKVIQAYEAGVTEKRLRLPKGLQRLLGDAQVRLEQSVFVQIHENKTPKGMKPAVVDTLRSSSISAEALMNREKFDALFVQQVLASETIELPKQPKSSNTIYKTDHLRIDANPKGSGTQTYWIVELQDNTGTARVGTRTASSTFAQVQVPDPGLKERKKGGPSQPGFRLNTWQLVLMLEESHFQGQCLTLDESTWRALIQKRGHGPRHPGSLSRFYMGIVAEKYHDLCLKMKEAEDISKHDKEVAYTKLQDLEAHHVNPLSYLLHERYGQACVVTDRENLYGADPLFVALGEHLLAFGLKEIRDSVKFAKRVKEKIINYLFEDKDDRAALRGEYISLFSSPINEEQLREELEKKPQERGNSNNKLCVQLMLRVFLRGSALFRGRARPAIILLDPARTPKDDADPLFETTVISEDKEYDRYYALIFVSDGKGFYDYIPLHLRQSSLMESLTPAEPSHGASPGK